MNSRSKQTRQQSWSDSPELSRSEDELSLDRLSDEELEQLLFDEEEKSPGFWNLSTITGLGLITVGIVYLFNQLGLLEGFQTAILADMLPWLAGILIILIGFGVLSWRPKRKKASERTSLRDVELDEPAKKKKATEELLRKQLKEKTLSTEKGKRLRRSRYDEKIAGVCGGIAEYLNIDSTLVRLIFVVGTIASAGTFVPLYIALWIIMPDPDELTPEERITIIRDS